MCMYTKKKGLLYTHIQYTIIHVCTITSSAHGPSLPTSFRSEGLKCFNKYYQTYKLEIKSHLFIYLPRKLCSGIYCVVIMCYSCIGFPSSASYRTLKNNNTVLTCIRLVGYFAYFEPDLFECTKLFMYSDGLGQSYS